MTVSFTNRKTTNKYSTAKNGPYLSSIDCYFWQKRGEVGIRYSTAKNGPNFSQLVVIFGKQEDKWELFYISGISAIDFPDWRLNRSDLVGWWSCLLF